MQVKSFNYFKSLSFLILFLSPTSLAFAFITDFCRGTSPILGVCDYNLLLYRYFAISLAGIFLIISLVLGFFQKRIDNPTAIFWIMRIKKILTWLIYILLFTALFAFIDESLTVHGDSHLNL